MSSVRLFTRALIAFLVLPGVVGFGVPLWMARRSAESGLDAQLNARLNAFGVYGAIVLLVGSVVLLWCVRDFYVAGKGTLAPWSPPKHLVVVGLYRWSRNPMYIGVLLVVIGWALGFRSRGHGIYALCLAIGFHLRVILGEEPWLARTHGAKWTDYMRAVPRWVW